MTKRYKIKQWFKKHFTKDKVFCIICVLSIVMIVFLCVYFENKDKEQMNSKTSDISLVDTEENLNKSFTINNDGNLVGENLFNGDLVSGYHSGSNGVLNEQSGAYVTNKELIYIGNIRTITLSWSFTTSFNIYLDGIAYYDNNQNFLSYEQMQSQTSPKTVSMGGNEYYISINFISYSVDIISNYLYNVMINYGDIALAWEPYGLWYSENNYNSYGIERYNNGRASVENQFYYFDNKLIQYYTVDDNFVGDEVLSQTSFTNFTINATDIIEPYYEMHESVRFYYGKIELNILSSEFYANFIYPVSTIDGYITIDYDDGTTYQVESYSLNREFHIYDGSTINPNKYIRYIYMQFHYDALLSIDINTSVNAVYYNNGYNAGYDNGYNTGSSASYENGRKNGYNQGYQVGYNEGATQDLTTNGFQTLCNSILSYPVNMLSQVFNFEFMGINIASTIFFLISCGIVLWIIKRLWK